MNLSNTKHSIIGFGEAMVRYAPTASIETRGPEKGQPELYLRSIGGDELNVMVALSRLGYSTHWVSVLPDQILGKAVKKSAVEAGVDISHVVTSSSNEEVGSFTVVPEEKRVHYRRSSSAFWKNENQEKLNWRQIFAETKPTWCHATGITPLCGEGACKSWVEHLNMCEEFGVPVSIDFNHRPALGTLEKLCDIMLPIMKRSTQLKLMIFSLKTLRGVALLWGLKNVPPASNFEINGGAPATSKQRNGNKRQKISNGSGTAETDPVWVTLMEQLFLHLGGKISIACCFKTRDSNGLQTRWSTIVTSQGTFTTKDLPTMHIPKDECGGGSAWAAGYIDAYLSANVNGNGKEVIRRGDMLAALCQETVGDHSLVTKGNLSCALTTFENKIALLQHQNIASGLADGITSPCGVESTYRNKILDANPLSWLLKQQIEVNLRRMPRLIAIIRAKNAKMAIKRGIELVEMGCKAVEVTFDTADFENVLRTLVSRCGDKALVGVGTAMSVEDVRLAAKLGAQFALSPINPPGFVAECLRLGLLAVPAAFTPTEVWHAHCQGAHFVKLFPAHLWNASTLKAMLTTGKLANVGVMPSGGISPDTAQSWFNAGAAGVGMGSCLCGKDIKIADENSEEFKQARVQWEEKGKDIARKAFAEFN